MHRISSMNGLLSTTMFRSARDNCDLSNLLSLVIYATLLFQKSYFLSNTGLNIVREWAHGGRSLEFEKELKVCKPTRFSIEEELI
jgi:hypothetical protein